LGIVVGPPPASGGVDEHQRADPLGMGRRELQRRVASSHAEHDRPFAADLVEHGDHVVDDGLNQAALDRRDRIGRTRPPSVEPSVAAERRQPVEEPNHPGFVPHQVDGKIGLLDG
jgi:hypothetical protein